MTAKSRASSMSVPHAASVAASAPALAPTIGVEARSSLRLNPVIAPACHQKKSPPPGNAKPRGWEAKPGLMIPILLFPNMCEYRIALFSQM
jgi:hypothetical protein